MSIRKFYYIFLIVLIPMAIVFFLYKAYVSYLDMNTFVQKETTLNMLTRTSSLESLFAREKYYSVLYLGVNGVNYMDELEDSRKKVKQYSKDFELLLSNSAADSSYKSAFGKFSDKLLTVRMSVDKIDDGVIGRLVGKKGKSLFKPLLRTVDRGISELNDKEIKTSLLEYMNLLDYKKSLFDERTLLSHFVLKKIKLSQNDFSTWESILEGNRDNSHGIVFDLEDNLEIIKSIPAVRGDIFEHSDDAQYATRLNDINRIFEDVITSLDNAEKSVIKKATDELRRGDSRSRYLMIQYLAVSALLLLALLFILRFKKRKKIEELAVEESLKEIVSDLDDEQRMELEKITKKGNRSEVYRFLSQTALEARASEERALKAEKSKDLFLANMSHEIRTPLNGILGFTQLMMGTPLSTEQKEFMGVIAGSSENLLKIVNDILDLSKIRADKIDLEMISFSVLQQMENTIEPLAARAIEKGIEYSAFIDPVLPKVIGDPTKLSQIMTNLIGNAVKFTGEGGSVDVDVRKIAENDNNVIIRFHVKDSGIGISKEQIENIFEPFSQADSSTTREFGGTGLGLTISRDIITHMGGVLDIISEEGKGSEFFFELGFEHAGADDDISNKLEGSQFVFYHSGESNLRQMERNLALYIRSSGGRYKVVGDSELGALDDDDILVLDYSNKDIRNKIDEMLDLNKKTILISTPSLKDQTDKLTSRIERIVYRPLTASKIIRAYESIFGSSIDNIPNEGANKNAQIRGLKVLVAEDNPINQKLILRVLEDLGTVPTLASNGKEAFDLRSANNYDIILMDVQMPVMGGLEAAQKIKKMEKYEGLPHAPIIALTANALQGDREKYLREGMDDYIPKPIRIEQVGMILRKYCEVNNSDSALKKLDRKEKPEKENIGEKSILLYCNDKLIQSIHSHVVDEAGFKMVSAENESEFLELFDSGVYEYVLIDAKILPENGDTLIKIIKGSGSIPMVYTTASSELTNITAESYSAIGMIRQILAR